MAKESILKSFLLTPWGLLGIIFLIVFMFGGGDFIFRNPIIIVFGILVWIIISWGGKK